MISLNFVNVQGHLTSPVPCLVEKHASTSFITAEALQRLGYQVPATVYQCKVSRHQPVVTKPARRHIVLLDVKLGGVLVKQQRFVVVPFHASIAASLGRDFARKVKAIVMKEAEEAKRKAAIVKCRHYFAAAVSRHQLAARRVGPSTVQVQVITTTVVHSYKTVQVAPRA